MPTPRHLRPAFAAGCAAARAGADYFTACPFSAAAEVEDWCAGYCGAQALAR